MTEENPPMPPAGDAIPGGLYATPPGSWGQIEMRDLHRKLDRYYEELITGMERLDERSELRWRRQRALISGVAIGLAVGLCLVTLTLTGIRDVGVRIPLWVIGAYAVMLVGYGITRPYPKPTSRADRVAQNLLDRLDGKEPLDGPTAPVRNECEPPAQTLLGRLGRQQRAEELRNAGVALSDPTRSDVENIEGDRRRIEGN